MIRQTLYVACVLSLALSASPALAQVDTSEWNCEFCPFADGYEADVEVGATNVSDDAARFGNATGYDESGTYANVDGQGQYAGEAYRLNWMAEDLGLDSRVFAVDGGKPGSFGFRLGYSELPTRLFNTTQTVFAESGNDALVLPSDWVYASPTQSMSGLSSALTSRDIASDRQLFNAGVDIESFSKLAFSADFRRQQRDGVQIMGGSSFFQSALLPRIIDYETDVIDLGMRYASGRLALNLGWYGSFFTNNASSLTWDNPFGLSPQGRHALEPDSDFRQLSLSGTYDVGGAFDSIIAFTIASGRGEQNDDLLAYTVNSGISAPSLPRSKADAEISTTHYALTVTTRPFDKARVRVNYRYDERDHQAPQDMWSRVIVDAFLTPGMDMNIPYSFERSTLGIEGSYRPVSGVRVSGGFERKELDRTFQEVTEQTEDKGYGQLQWRPTGALEMKLRGGNSRRNINNYDQVLAIASGQNPLMRKYNQAYRYREFAEVTLGFTPADKPVSATLNALYGDDSYSRSEIGLLSGDSLQISGDVSWAISERASVYLHASEEEIESEQANSTLSEPNWSATHDDDFSTIGGGVRFRNIADKVDLTLDYSTSSGESEIIVDPATGVSISEFPELESQFDDLRLMLSYQSSEKLTWNLTVRYQLFETEDWALEGLSPDAAPSLLSLGAAPYDEDVVAVGLGISYRVGGEEE